MRDIAICIAIILVLAASAFLVYLLFFDRPPRSAIQIVIAPCANLANISYKTDEYGLTYAVIDETWGSEGSEVLAQIAREECIRRNNLLLKQRQQDRIKAAQRLRRRGRNIAKL